MRGAEHVPRRRRGPRNGVLAGSPDVPTDRRRRLTWTSPSWRRCPRPGRRRPHRAGRARLSRSAPRSRRSTGRPDDPAGRSATTRSGHGGGLDAGLVVRRRRSAGVAVHRVVPPRQFVGAGRPARARARARRSPRAAACQRERGRAVLVEGPITVVVGTLIPLPAGVRRGGLPESSGRVEAGGRPGCDGLDDWRIKGTPGTPGPSTGAGARRVRARFSGVVGAVLQRSTTRHRRDAGRSRIRSSMSATAEQD